jgi:osmotically-inducible protein OsmY
MPLKPLVLLLSLVPLLTGCAAAVIGGGSAAVAVVHDRRTTATVLEDQNISIKIFNYIQKRDSINKFSDISSNSYNRRVLLTGAAATPAISQQVAKYAQGLGGVREVINEIEIHPEYDGSVQGTLDDAYIDAQVKLRLFNIKLDGFDPTRLDITTYNGSVYLMGLVTRTEGSAAAEEARYVQKVKRVVKHLEYFQPQADDGPAPNATEAPDWH